MASYHLKPCSKGGSKRKNRQPSPQVAKLKAARRAPYTPGQLLAYQKCECDAIFDQNLKPSTPEERFRAKYQRRANSLHGGYNLDYICPEHRVIRSANGTCLACDAADAQAQYPQCPVTWHSPAQRGRKPPSRKKKAPRRAVTLRA